jgi:acetylornithine deacetylase
MAIYVEPTMLDIYVAHMGFFLCDVRVLGKSAYFGVPELGIDARFNRADSHLDPRSLAAERRPAQPSLFGSGWAADRHSGGGYIAVPGNARSP